MEVFKLFSKRAYIFEVIKSNRVSKFRKFGFKSLENFSDLSLKSTRVNSVLLIFLISWIKFENIPFFKFTITLGISHSYFWYNFSRVKFFYFSFWWGKIFPRESATHFELEDAYFLTVEDFNREGRVTVVFIQKTWVFSEEKKWKKIFIISEFKLRIFSFQTVCHKNIKAK